MEILPFEELRERYWDSVELFCLKVLHNDAEAILNAANVFTTFQRMIADGWYEKVGDLGNVKAALFLIARTRCIQRLQWLRMHDEKRRENRVGLFFRRIIKYVTCKK